MTPRQECAEALRKLADELEGGEPHEVLRLAALAHWRLNEAINLINESEPKKPHDSEP